MSRVPPRPHGCPTCGAPTDTETRQIILAMLEQALRAKNSTLDFVTMEVVLRDLRAEWEVSDAR